MAFTPNSRRNSQMADINMTPLIDVMLVLLIIFMVAAPMLTTGMEVSLPESRTGKNLESQVPVVILAGDGKYQFENSVMTATQLQTELKKRAVGAAKAQGVVVRGDQHVSYGKVIELMDLIREAGFTNVGLSSQQAVSPQKSNSKW
ncbi:MAG: ExbD/TolR family protein [Holophagales bacterium]|jgi:biopolymer transport protein TolR|nr:ExbD/TolR family protein [Holophagales bacterium]